jgi:hypothetical protein
MQYRVRRAVNTRPSRWGNGIGRRWQPEIKIVGEWISALITIHAFPLCLPTPRAHFRLLFTKGGIIYYSAGRHRGLLGRGAHQKPGNAMVLGIGVGMSFVVL